MKKIIMLLVSGAMAFGLAACSNDDTMPTGNIKTADQLYLPRNNASIELETNNDTYFEWEGSTAAGNGSVIYELLFDKEDGNFSEPLYVLKSDNNGYSPAAKVEAKTLNTVAKLAGADLGEQATVKWTVRAWCGLVSELYGSEAGVRTMSIVRVNSVDPMPSEVSLKGTITEDKNDIVLFPASVIHTSKGTYKDEREEGAYEFFAKLTEGSFSIVDDLDRQYAFGEKGRMRLIKDGEPETATGTISKEGIYWIYVNFSMMTYKVKEIQKVEFLLSSPNNKAELIYDGSGVWSIDGYEWNVKIGGNTDTRHKFICTYADGSTEYWGHFEDDCRGSGESEANKNPLFYNIFRHSYNGNWDNTWKTNEAAKEGFGDKVTFRLHMNNTDAKLFLLERSFKQSDKLDIPSEVKISGDATEGKATLTLSKASVLHTQKGTFKDDREAGAFEIYTKLTAGSMTIADNNGIQLILGDDGKIKKAAGQTTTIKEEGIYRLYMNFNTGAYALKKISKVEFWLLRGGKAELNYQGDGMWKVSNFAWNVNNSQGDSRYKFICTFADNSVEHWGHFEDDSRDADKSDADKNKLFYNVFRLSTSIGEWDHAWKTNEAAKEGFGKLVSFRIYMNNTKGSLFLHERSFTTPGDAVDDTPPTQVSIQGAATEGQAKISLNAALPILTTAGNDDLVVNREADAFECFTKLTAGKFSVTDGERYFELKADNSIGYTNIAKDVTVSETGIYWVYMNFKTNTWKMKKISKVEFWQRPWFGHSIPDTAEMTYKGSGEWSITDFAWEPSHSDGRKDTRYYFICTYADNTKERWGYYSNDCREPQNKNPENYPNFFNIYRFDSSKMTDDWADSWKTKGDSEGVGQKATFHVYMNNTHATDYKHTRSFK